VSVGDGGIISPSGSIITGLGGQVALEVPSAAVTQSSRIIIALPTVVLASRRLIPGSAVSLRTQAPLTQSALLTIRYNPNRILGSPESGLRLYKATLTEWQPVAGSTVNVNSNTVRGRISSGGVFGIFAQASVGSVSVSPVSGGLKAGESKLFASLVKDADGNQLEGRAEVWSSSAPAVIQIDAASGRATANSPGSAVITATVEEKSGSTTVLVTPGVAARIEIVRGDRQSADTGAAIAIAPSVKVTDQAGFAVSGAIVQFAVVSGNGAISPASATTDTTGIATVDRWVLGSSAGQNTATATIAGGASVTFSSTATLPPPPQPPVVTPPTPPAQTPAPKLTPTTIAIFAGDGQSAPPFAAVPISPAVRVTDANGAPVRDVIVTFSIRAAGRWEAEEGTLFSQRERVSLAAR